MEFLQQDEQQHIEQHAKDSTFLNIFIHLTHMIAWMIGPHGTCTTAEDAGQTWIMLMLQSKAAPMAVTSSPGPRSSPRAANQSCITNFFLDPRPQISSHSRMHGMLAAAGWEESPVRLPPRILKTLHPWPMPPPVLLHEGGAGWANDRSGAVTDVAPSWRCVPPADSSEEAKHAARKSTRDVDMDPVLSDWVPLALTLTLTLLFIVSLAGNEKKKIALVKPRWS
jgi:hypothetical protein